MRFLLICLCTALIALLPSAELAQAAELKLSSAFSQYGRGYAPIKAERHGEICTLTGLGRTKNGQKPSSKTIIGHLSSDCRPAGALIFDTNNHTSQSRINVFPDGRVEWYRGFNYSWVSLGGISFPVGKVSKTLSTGKGWQHYPGWQGAGSYRQDNQCILTGLLRRTAPIKLPSNLTALPSNCRPSERLIFNQQNLRVDVYPNGVVRAQSGKLGRWSSLSGIKFHVGKSGSSLKLLNSWRNYGSGYAPATYYVDGSGFCTLGGLIRGTQLSDLLQLPNSCRPKERLLMNVNSSGGRHARVDIMPSGQVRWIRGNRSSWISLAGLTVSAAVSREPTSQAAAEARLMPGTAISITPSQQAQMTEYLNEQNKKIAKVLTDQDRKSLQQLAAEIQAAQLVQNTRERASQFDAINARYGSLRKSIMNRANIANEDIYARLAAIAPELDLRIDEDRISSLRRGALNSIRNPTELPAEELTEFPESFMNPVCGDLSLTSPARRRGVAHEYTQDTFLVGGCRVDTGVGAALTVPPNVSRVHVQMDVSSLVAITSAAFGIAGYAQANTDLGIHIAGPGLSQFDVDRSVIAIAPVAFAMLADDRRNEVQVLRTSFVPLQEGGEYRIFLYTGHFTLGIPFPLAPATAGLSMATVFNLDKITARFQR